MYCGYVVKVENLRPHNNADRLQIATFFGNDTCVGLDVVKGEIGIYFPVDGQLSVEYCEVNNLVRKKDENGNNIGGYMDPDKRNVTAVRLRGERSDGLFMPLSSLVFTGVNMDDINIGDKIDIVNGIEICHKYIPRSNKRVGKPTDGNRTRKHKVPTAPLFAEHADTEQLAYNLGAFKPGDELEISLKIHGTSQRTGLLPVLKGYKKSFWEKVLRKEGTPIYDWDYVTGTRRTVLENYEGGYYGDNEFREQHAKIFEGKLNRGETVYYEVCGFTTTEAPIMSSGKVPKEAQAQYGDTMVFSYGCEPTGKKLMYGIDEAGEQFAIEQAAPQSDLYVYRMTLTTEEGHVIEYTPDYTRYRCEQMGIQYVPVFAKAILSNDRLHLVSSTGEDHDYLIGDKTIGDLVIKAAEEYYDGPDPIGKNHVREGVVVRIINRPKFAAYKHKNFLFKQISGIITDKIADSNVEISEDILAEM